VNAGVVRGFLAASALYEGLERDALGIGQFGGLCRRRERGGL
jgi:hypothetical protein